MGSKKIIRGLLVCLAAFLVFGSAILATKALKDAYQLASDAGLKQAAGVYSHYYQLMQPEKLKPKNEKVSVSFLFQKFIYGLQALDEGTSILNPALGYQVFVFNHKGGVVGEIDISAAWDGGLETRPPINKVNDLQEQLIKSSVGDDLAKFFRNPDSEILVEVPYGPGESPDGFFNRVLNPTQRYLLTPMLRPEDESSTKHGIIITRSTKTLNAQSTIMREALQENLTYLVGYSLIALLLFVLLLRVLNRLINQKTIAEGWHHFSHDVGTPISNIKRHTRQLARESGISPRYDNDKERQYRNDKERQYLSRVYSDMKPLDRQQLERESGISPRYDERFMKPLEGKQRSIVVISKAIDHIEEALNQQKMLMIHGEDGVLKLEPLALTPIIEEATQNIAMIDRLTSRHLPLIRPRYSDTSLQIKANKTSMLRAITNLIKNAIEFSPINGTIQLLVYKEGHDVVITIYDQGAGISEEVESTLGQGKSAPREGGEVGQGLGLTIVEKAMKVHGGELVWPRNRADQQGTEVSIKLPILRSTTISSISP